MILRFGASRLVRDRRGRVGLVRWCVFCFLFLFLVCQSPIPQSRENTDVWWLLMSPTCSLEMRLWLRRSLLYLVVNKFLIPFFSI